MSHFREKSDTREESLGAVTRFAPRWKKIPFPRPHPSAAVDLAS
jgi:hypothetical protein